eukprot:2418397-Karenia_brevis.AAC.1
MVAEHLSRRCTNTSSSQKHRHVHLMNGRARKAQVYPPELCKAMCRGIKEQKDHDAKREYLIGSFDVEQESHEQVKMAKMRADQIHEDHDEHMIAIDDVTGAKLDIKLVREAREAEMRYFKKMGVYRKVPISKCIQQTGKMPIG